VDVIQDFFVVVALNRWHVDNVVRKVCVHMHVPTLVRNAFETLFHFRETRLVLGTASKPVVYNRQTGTLIAITFTFRFVAFGVLVVLLKVLCGTTDNKCRISILYVMWVLVSK
jgi:hypothetical protein